MRDKINTIILSIISVLCVILLSVTLIDYYKYRILAIENNNLVKENIRLEMSLTEKENEIYALSLDLISTERTLADTAMELDRLAEELESQKNLQLTYVGEYTCTAYCTERYPHICGGGGNTASGAPVTPNVSVAVTDLKTLPYGTVIYIDGVGIRIVQDTGGFSKNKIDCAVKTHKEAMNWKGQGKHKVYIINIEE